MYLRPTHHYRPLDKACVWDRSLEVQELWPPPPRDWGLNRWDVHVWSAALDQPQDHVRYLAETLNEAERARAHAIVVARARQRFVAARGLLRQLLASYLHISPLEVQFAYGQWGKPEVVADLWDQPLHFNVTHSGGLALFAVTRLGKVGLDVEQIRRVSKSEHIVSRFFSPAEQAAIQALPEALREEAFFACWTRKEAFIKATGVGLRFPLASFDVSVSSQEPTRLLRVDGDQQAPDHWSIYSMTPAPGYIGALVVEGQPRQLACWSLPLANRS